jgi:apolipoprotein N-acyltransferase
MLWGISLYSANHDWTVPRADEISVALVQGAVPQQLKWTPEMRQPTLDRYFELTEPHLGTDLIIWPEAAIPAFYHQIEAYITRLMQLTRATDSYLLTGLPYQDPQTGKYLNSVVMLGDEVSFYFKRHLVPFGEYLPLDFILRDVFDYLGIPMSDFSAGDNTPPVLRTKKFNMGISICYEDTFGEEVIEALPDAALEWQGDCFVFDNRIALDTHLRESPIQADQVYDPQFPDEQWRLQRARQLERSAQTLAQPRSDAGLAAPEDGSHRP